ncbi:MAG: UDP-N-acetylmuramoylalanine--D-glutamate ligase [Omnitrophica WOR_2 bacterium RIFCSPHIGHO2_02_FULL_68_15]|nr:MAG: UDP-N-acetylmuramoylalanine--D-glutamate ligase [Omnitrophica WOR_2 bacterium RIFCSPHIGHO2_02_FULL_68_15]
MNVSLWPGHTVLVVGLGKSGQSACAFLQHRGCRVRATESARTPALEALAQSLTAGGATVELGGHTEALCDGSRLVVVSPGVPPTALPLQWARRRGVPVIGELELGARFCAGRLVAITGSNGKSTVTTLVGAMLETAEQPAVVAGNIGTPLTSQLSRIQFGTTVVLEVSSFQLEHVDRFRPAIACVLNVTPNHLDRHASFEDYAAAKRRLLTQQGRFGWAVVNADDPVCQAMASAAPGRRLEFSVQRPVRGAYLADGALWLVLRARRYRVMAAEEIPLLGPHNTANALAAIAIGGLLGLDPDTMAAAIRRFRGLPHRLERVADWRGITFINDSKSTTVEAGLRALECCPGKAVLIAGGKDKGSDFTVLRRPAGRMVRAAVLIGADAPRLASALEPVVPVRRAGTLCEAVQTAVRLAQPGDWVLLSPMCTSFDMFQDFEDRGAQFTDAVRALIQLEQAAVLA